jgi:hypothetical protein
MSRTTRSAWRAAVALFLSFSFSGHTAAHAALPQTHEVVARTSIGAVSGPTLLRIVLPLPPGQAAGLVPGALSPFSLKAGNDVLATQWMPCRWHADGSLASIELSAWIHRATVDGEVVVVRASGALLPAAIPSETVALFLSGFGFNVEGPAGNVVVPLSNVAGQVTLGPAYAEIEDGGSLGPYGGFRYWARALRGSPLVELDLVWHNADTSSPDPDIRFDRASLLLPPNWRALSVIPRPDVHTIVGTSGPTRYVMADGGPHALLQLHEHHFRVVLHQDVDQPAAQRLASWLGWGVCLPDGGGWSFWNSASPWFTGHGVALPIIAHYTRQTFIDRVKADWAFTRSTLLTGTQFTGSPHGKLGWLHMQGTPYGGATGGDALEFAPAMEALRAGVAEGILDHIALCWADTCRGTGNLYDAVGRPFDVDGYIAAKSLDDQVDFRFEMLPEAVGGGHTNKFLNDDEDFGFTTAGDRFASDPGAASYEWELRSYGSFDAQHVGRYLYEPIVLAAAANDRIGKHLLEARAMASRADNYEGKGGAHFGRYGWLADSAASFPGQGSSAGRGEGWSLDLYCETYSFLPPWERAWLKRPIERLCDLMWHAQTPSGFVQATCDGKAAWSVTPGGSSAPVYRCAAQPYEACIQANALAKAASFAFTPAEARWQTSQRTLLDLVRAQGWAWHPAGSKTWGTIALRDSAGAPLYPTQADVPNDGKIDTSNYYLRGPLVYAALAAFRLSDLPALKDVVFLTLLYADQKTLLAKMQENYLQELGMKAHLFWVAETIPQSLLEALLLL